MKLDARTKIILVIFTSFTYGMRLTILENAVLVLGLSLLFWFSGKRKMAIMSPIAYSIFVCCPILHFYQHG